MEMINPIIIIVISSIFALCGYAIGYDNGRKDNSRSDTDNLSDINCCKNLEEGLSSKIDSFLESKYNASMRLKAIVKAFVIYIKSKENYYRIDFKDICMDEDDDIVIVTLDKYEESYTE